MLYHVQTDSPVSLNTIDEETGLVVFDKELMFVTDVTDLEGPLTTEYLTVTSMDALVEPADVVEGAPAALENASRIANTDYDFVGLATLKESVDVAQVELSDTSQHLGSLYGDSHRR